MDVEFLLEAVDELVELETDKFYVNDRNLERKVSYTIKLLTGNYKKPTHLIMNNKTFAELAKSNKVTSSEQRYSSKGMVGTYDGVFVFVRKELRDNDVLVAIKENEFQTAVLAKV